MEKLKITVLVLLSVFCTLSAQLKMIGFINIGADKIYYEYSGEGDVIILIHDGVLNNEVWDEQFSKFSKSYKVIRYDRRGYGRSSAATESYSNVDDLNTLFEHLLVKKAWLFGISSGGRLAIDFTLEHPDKVNGLVLVGAVVGGFSNTSHFYTRGGHLPMNITDEIKLLTYYVSQDPYEIYSGNAAARKKALNLIKEFPPKSNSTGNLEQINRAKIPSYRRLNEIKVPALVLVGEFDIPDVHAHAGVIGAGILNSERDIIPKSGHLIPLEQPELFDKRVESFLFDYIY